MRREDNAQLRFIRKLLRRKQLENQRMAAIQTLSETNYESMVMYPTAVSNPSSLRQPNTGHHFVVALLIARRLQGLENLQTFFVPIVSAALGVRLS